MLYKRKMLKIYELVHNPGWDTGAPVEGATADAREGRGLLRQREGGAPAEGVIADAREGAWWRLGA